MARQRLLFVGIPQAHVRNSIARAQRLGFEVLLGDTEANLAAKHHLISGADRLVITDYTRYESLSETARALHREKPLAAIFTFKEGGALATAMVAQDYRFKTNAPEVIDSVNNKFKTRELLRAAGFPGPAYGLCGSAAEARHFSATAGGPIILKPHNLQGSRGIQRADTPDQVAEAFARCLAVCEQPVVLAEELVTGREISIEAMVFRSEVVLFGITEKLLYAGSFVELGHISPDRTQETCRPQYQAIVGRLVRAMGITFGPLHIEGFLTAQGFVPGELHTRYGGDEIVGLTELAMKCDMTSPIFAELGDLPYELTFGEPREVTGIRFLSVAPGVVKAIEGLDAAERLPGVVRVQVDLGPGDQVRPVQSSFDRVGWIMCRGATRAELDHHLDRALAAVRICTTPVERQQNLRIPGPTPLPGPVSAALGRPMISHRGPEFAALLRRVTERLQLFFQTSEPVLGFPSAGSGVMEAAILNCFSPGDEVLVASMGVFGERFATIARLFGLQVTHLQTPWGQAVDPDHLEHELRRRPAVCGVLLTHNETSTGVTNDLPTLAARVRSCRPDVLVVVDAISSLPSLDVRMQDWDLDVVLSASQKGWMAPPGLALVGVGPRAWAAHARARLPRLYWDFRTARLCLEKGQTPWTPPVSVYFALDVALELLLAEGRETIIERHRRLGELTRAGVRALGLELFAESAHASNTVTAVRVPAGIDAQGLLAALHDREGVVIAGGQESLDGLVIRIGHLGYVEEREMVHCIEALRRQLTALGYRVPEPPATRVVVPGPKED